MTSSSTEGEKDAVAGVAGAVAVAAHLAGKRPAPGGATRIFNGFERVTVADVEEDGESEVAPPSNPLAPELEVGLAPAPPERVLTLSLLLLSRSEREFRIAPTSA